MNNKVERLQNGETFTTHEGGNSMVPLIHSHQKHVLAPATWDQCKKGDIVYCKVNGRFYTHLVKATCAKRGCLITNNHGRTNGWTKKVFGKVIEVLPK
jgi:hypothetical protein